ncbi:C-type lectin BfL-2-like [Thamnophis elegans]|uniref:C-type lectin BfL-2-like n=1 Tax=Thamnophis elegans TaxID=35005 RepID=UPI001378D148|nr:C-type lectin BfL-2-like [Thamnophis elegans]
MGLFMHITLCCLGVLITNYFLGVKAETCSTGWLKKQRTCYGYFNEELSWHEAETKCQSYNKGCHLASLLNNQESKLVAQYIKNKQNSGSSVWIGLSDENEKRQWQWADGSTFSYDKWNAGEPNNKYEEYCVELTSDTNFRKWNDLSCDRLNAYICKCQM